MIAKDSRFVRKVYLIVTQEDAALVSWTPDGRAFTIHDTAGFQRAIKTKHHLSSLCTFRQNLRAHGFEEIELTRDDDGDDRGDQDRNGDDRDGARAGAEDTRTSHNNESSNATSDSESNSASATQRQQRDATSAGAVTVKKEQSALQLPSEAAPPSESALLAPPPETYYHPCFVRGRPELLAQITFDARLKFRCQECKRHPNERGAKCSTRRRESVSSADAESVKRAEVSSDKETGACGTDRPASPPRPSVGERPEWRRPLDSLAQPMVASSSASSLRVTLRAPPRLPPPPQPPQQQREVNNILALSAASVYSDASAPGSDGRDATNTTNSNNSNGHGSSDMLPGSSGAFLRPSPASLASSLRSRPLSQTLANERVRQAAQAQSSNGSSSVGLSAGPGPAQADTDADVRAAADRKPPASDGSLMVRLSFGRQDAVKRSSSSSQVHMPAPPSFSERTVALPTVATDTRHLHSALSPSPSPSPSAVTTATAVPSLTAALPSRAPASVVPVRSPCPLASIMNPSPLHRDDTVRGTTTAAAASSAPVPRITPVAGASETARGLSSSGSSRGVDGDADVKRALVRPTYVAPVRLAISSARSAPVLRGTRAPLSTGDATKRLAGLALVPSLAAPMRITLCLGRRAQPSETRASPSSRDAPMSPTQRQQQQRVATRVPTVKSMDEARVLIKAEEAPTASSRAPAALPRPEPLHVQLLGRDASRKRPRPHATVASLPALAVATTPSTGSLCFSIKPAAARASSEQLPPQTQMPHQQQQQVASARPSGAAPHVPVSTTPATAPPSSSSPVAAAPATATAPTKATAAPGDSVASLSRSAASSKEQPRRESNDSAAVPAPAPASPSARAPAGAVAGTTLSFRVKLPAGSVQSSRKRPSGADDAGASSSSSVSASASVAPKRSRTRAHAATTLVAKAGGKDDENALSLLVLASAKRQ